MAAAAGNQAGLSRLRECWRLIAGRVAETAAVCKCGIHEKKEVAFEGSV
jgi:hypothetical protein